MSLVELKREWGGHPAGTTLEVENEDQVRLLLSTGTAVRASVPDAVVTPAEDPADGTEPEPQPAAEPAKPETRPEPAAVEPVRPEPKPAPVRPVMPQPAEPAAPAKPASEPAKPEPKPQAEEPKRHDEQWFHSLSKRVQKRLSARGEAPEGAEQ